MCRCFSARLMHNTHINRNNFMHSVSLQDINSIGPMTKTNFQINNLTLERALYFQRGLSRRKFTLLKDWKRNWKIDLHEYTRRIESPSPFFKLNTNNNSKAKPKGTAVHEFLYHLDSLKNESSI